jgi:hypothetical protein
VLMYAVVYTTVHSTLLPCGSCAAAKAASRAAAIDLASMFWSKSFPGPVRVRRLDPPWAGARPSLSRLLAASGWRPLLASATAEIHHDKSDTARGKGNQWHVSVAGRKEPRRHPATNSILQPGRPRAAYRSPGARRCGAPAPHHGAQHKGHVAGGTRQGEIYNCNSAPAFFSLYLRITRPARGEERSTSACRQQPASEGRLCGSGARG